MAETEFPVTARRAAASVSPAITSGAAPRVSHNSPKSGANRASKSGNSRTAPPSRGKFDRSPASR
jgi:hypothetical protein